MQNYYATFTLGILCIIFNEEEKYGTYRIEKGKTCHVLQLLPLQYTPY